MSISLKVQNANEIAESMVGMLKSEEFSKMYKKAGELPPLPELGDRKPSNVQTSTKLNQPQADKIALIKALNRIYKGKIKPISEDKDADLSTVTPKMNQYAGEAMKVVKQKYNTTLDLIKDVNTYNQIMAEVNKKMTGIAPGGGTLATTGVQGAEDPYCMESNAETTLLDELSQDAADSKKKEEAAGYAKNLNIPQPPKGPGVTEEKKTPVASKADDVVIAYAIKGLSKISNALDVNGYAGLANVIDEAMQKVASLRK
jgi:hypothetical protein